MQRHATVTTLRELAKQKATRDMTIGIDLGDRRSHFCVLNEQAQVIARGVATLLSSSKCRVPGDCARALAPHMGCVTSSEADVKIAAPSITFGPQHAPSQRRLTKSANRSRA
jgi:activator of 2-hydroxyglutaryl-CoA dehydratase